MPKITITQSDEELERLERLARLWGSGPSRAIAWAIRHSLASIERGQGILTIVPSEHPDELPWSQQQQDEQKPKPTPD